MKKTLLSILTLISIGANAQTLTFTNHAPAWGNIPYQTTQCDSTGVVAGATGADAVWSFTPTNTHSLKTYNTSNSLPTNTLYPASNVAVASSTADIAYYNSSATNLKYYGGNIVIAGFNISLVFNNPSLYAIYPMSLGTSTTSTPSGTISINGAINGTFTGNASVNATGTGTLVLPLKTFNDVIQLTTSQTLNATLSLGTGVVTTVTYDYYSISSSKAPIYSIQTSTIQSTLGGTSTQTIVTVQNNYQLVSVNENEKSDIALSVFPNPTTNLINFNTANLTAHKIIATDITGKIISTELFDAGKAKMNTYNLSSGIYLYRVIDKNNQTLTTGKFNVSK
ncbi:MAG: T9SS type A sorting domain-containing protein [Bacteroidia bacterium]|nr:T9SS type A sorting domain-containing protein [Bacteroidia bacterium]